VACHSQRTLPLVAALVLLATTTALRAEEAIKVRYITDLSRCTPKSAVSDGPREGRWQLIPYETAGDPNVKGGPSGSFAAICRPAASW
jgi:hypothetical protein